MIKLTGIYKDFYKKNIEINALKGIDLQVEKGDIYGIIGYSGSGKSTLVRIINLLERPTKGHVFYQGQEITSFSESELIPIRRKIGMIFQQFNLLSSATVYKNIAYPLELVSKDKTEINNKVESLLELVDLANKKNDYPASLSGGQKQRVAIARALASDPDVLLCDEGTSALDPKTTQSILKLLKRINQELGITIVLITHEMDVVRSICNKVAVISDGIVVEKNTTAELFANPGSEITKELINPSILV